MGRTFRLDDLGERGKPLSEVFDFDVKHDLDEFVDDRVRAISALQAAPLMESIDDIVELPEGSLATLDGIRFLI